MLENIRARGVTRLFIDGVEGLRSIVMHPERAPSFLIALVHELRVRGVTTFITEQLPYFKESIATANASASALYENIMLVEYVRGAEGNYRQLSVLKLRENDYDSGSCQMIISANGISVGNPAIISSHTDGARNRGHRSDGQ
jgi:circadian clock protein KaiC